MFKYVTPEYARKYYDTSDNTLRKWGITVVLKPRKIRNEV
jgi:hypothetical protein